MDIEDAPDVPMAVDGPELSDSLPVQPRSFESFRLRQAKMLSSHPPFGEPPKFVTTEANALSQSFGFPSSASN